MKIFYKAFIFTVLCFLFSQFSIAQKNDMFFHYLTADDGLSQNRVRCILRDSRENMWFGTYDGLNKYNGSQVTIYRNQANNSKSISCDQITDILEDAKKNIWVATEGGLNLYVPTDGSFVLFKNIPSDNSSISGNYINCIYSDKQQNVWFGVENGKEGLNKWNPNSKTFTRYQISGSENSALTNAVTGIVQDKNGNIWVAGRDNGIFRFEPDKSKFTCYTDTSFNSLGTKKRLFIDNDNIIWIATYGTGLFSFDPANNKFTKYNSSGKGKGTNGKLIDDIIQEDSNNLLIAIDQGGINRYNKRTKMFEYIIYEPSNTKGLNNNGIWCLYKDKEGILWVGTSGGGVNFHNPKYEKFKLFRNIPGEPNSLSYDVVGSIYEDSKGLLWIAIDGGGVSVYDPQTQKFKNYKNDSKDPFSLPCNVIRHVVEDKNHNYWIGTWDGGLIKLDHKTGRFNQYWPESSEPFNISGRNIWNSVIDHKGIVWLSMTEFGVDLLDPDKGIIKRFRPNPALKGSLSHRYVNFMYEDRHLNMWLCTNDGLDLFDSVTNSFKVYKGFPSNDMRSFVEDKEGYYWAGTINKGIMRFKMNGDILKVYDKSNGLPSNLINGILEDNNNNIWVSTGDGISRINYKTGKIRNYSIGDGLQGKQFFLHSCLKTRSGEMYFGGFNGLNSFFPDSLKDNDYIPPVYINEFLIFNKPVTVGQPGSPLQKVIEQTEEIALNWEQSVFSFGFVAVNYTHPEKNLYAYKMEGFDKDWNYTDDSRRLATYTNLNPGKYTFRVKASNNDGIWNETGASIKITILPPWWLTWWFKTFVGLSILCFALGFYFYKVNNLERQKKQLESLVKQRTQEVEEKNSILVQQTQELSTNNEKLIEDQQQIEKQGEELRVNSDNLKSANEQLIEKQEIILLQTDDLKDKNKELENYINVTSHDLRSPLVNIQGFSNRFQKQIDTVKNELSQCKFETETKNRLEKITIEDIPKTLHFILSNVTKMETLINGLLQISRTGRVVLKITKIDMNHLLKAIIASHNFEITELSAKVIIQDLSGCYGDENLLNQLFSNIIGNALKYRDPNRQLVIEIASQVQSNKVIYSISDTGIGIEARHLEKIWNVFYRVDPDSDVVGEGIGLNLTKRIVDKHKGKIWVESEVGKGSVFYVELQKNKFVE